MPRDLHRRRDAVLALADARDAMAKGKITQATEGASQANRLAPGLVPAAAMTARLATAEGNPTQAAKIIKTAWGHCPHPDLAAAFADIAPDETPAKRLARFKPLLSVQPQHAQTRLLEAELQIAAEDFHAARRALGDLATTQPTTRSLTIMAAIEKGLGGDDHIVRAWLAKGVTASRGPQWICGKCGHISADWHPVCQNCDGFDTLSWEESQQSDASLAGAVDMLPHIIGLLEEDPPIRPAIIAQDDTAFGDIKSQD
jgi:HemY protein